MLAAKNKSRRYERIFRKYFPKLIVIAVAVGTFLMLHARLRQSPMGKPPEDPLSFYQKDKFLAHVGGATLGADLSNGDSNELGGLLNGPEKTFEIPLDALVRFLSDSIATPRAIVLGPERPTVYVAKKPGGRPRAVHLALPVSKRESLPISIEANWDVSSDGDAVNDTSPLTSIFYESLSDAPLMGSYDADAMISSVHLSVESKPATVVLPAIPRIRTLIGIVKQNSFENEKKHLFDLNTQFTDTELPPFQREILPTLMARMQPPPPSILSRPIPSTIDKRPALDAREAMEELETEKEAVQNEELKEKSAALWVREAEATWKSKPSVAVAANNLSPNMIDGAKAFTLPSTTVPKESRPQTSFPSESGKVYVDNANHSANSAGRTQVADNPKMDTQDPSNHLETPAGDTSDSGSERIVGNRILGKLDLTQDAIEWLESKKGHIELYLQGPKTRDSQDTIFLNYTYPASEFEIDTTILRRPYQLSATVYLPGSSLVFSTVVYPHFISQDTHQRLSFKIQKDQLIKRKAVRGSANPVSLTMTVFEALSGNYRHPAAVAGAQVELVGMGVNGKFVSSPEGTVRIASIAARSEYMIRVSAPGFLPTEKIIPVFDGPQYTTIYLVPEPKVADITRYFNQSPQKHANSVLIGRSFDPVTRVPKANEQFTVSFRKSGPIYFGALPDPGLKQTTEQGLFGFFNITPSARVLSRENAPYGILTNCRAGYGYYAEWGRGGEKSIFGRVEDPFNLTPLSAKISWVGISDRNVETDHANRFEFSKVDLPPGIVTFEIDIEGYPTTWHTVSWSTRERADEHVLHVLEKALIQENTKRFSKRETSQEVGAVIGGAAGGFFKRAECIQVELLSADGALVDLEHGPYHFSKKRAAHEKFCLTSKHPGFSYVNLIPGEYIMKFYENIADRERKLIRSKIIRIGANRVSIAVQ